MSQSNIDRLFEKKLNQQSVAPSDQAKDKFYALIDKKEKKAAFVWWKIAAAMLVLAVSSLLLWNYSAQKDNHEIAATKTEQVKPDQQNVVKNKPDVENSPTDGVDSEMDIIEKPSPLRENKSMVSLADNAEPERKKTKPEKAEELMPLKGQEIIENSIVAAVNTTAMEIQPGELVPDSIEASKIILAEVEEQTMPAKKRLPVTIIYKSSKADNSVIAMEQFQDDLDSLEDNQSKSLKSIIQTAANSSLLSGIRGAKNDILNLDIPTLNKKVNN